MMYHYFLVISESDNNYIVVSTSEQLEAELKKDWHYEQNPLFTTDTGLQTINPLLWVQPGYLQNGTRCKVM